MATRPVGRREANKQDKLRRITEAALFLFGSRGYDETTTREIARHAGVGLGTVFLYAETKRDLLFLIVNDGLAERLQTARALIRPEQPLLENLLTVFRLHYDYYGRQPVLARLVLREMNFYSTGTQAELFRKTRSGLIALIVEIVAKAVENGLITSDEPPDFIASTIFSIYQVEVREWLAGEPAGKGKALAKLRRALEMLVHGIGTRI